MKKALLFMLIAIMLFGLVTCAEPVLSDVLQSDKQRGTSPVATQADLVTLVDGNSSFAFSLYQALEKLMATSFTRRTASLWLWR